MAIEVQCQCGRMLRVPEEHAGKQGKCPSCGSSVQIPTSLENDDLTLELADESPAPAKQTGRLSTCAKCQQPVPGSGNFCDHCGAPVVAGIEGAAGKLCPQCMNLCPAKAVLCMHCENKFELPQPVLSTPPLRSSQGGASPVRTRSHAGFWIGPVMKWSLLALVVLGLYFGYRATTNYFMEMEFKAQIRGGDDWLGKGYPGDAEECYQNAEKVFPGREIVKERMARAQAYRESQKARKKQGLPHGPVMYQALDSMEYIQRKLDLARRKAQQNPLTANRTIQRAPAKKLGKRHYEKEGGFSYQPPEGWQKRQILGMQYNTFESARPGANQPYLSVVVDASAADLRTFVKKSLEKSVGKLGLKVTKEEFLKSSNGQPAARIVFKYKLGNLSFQTLQYILDAGKRKIVFSGTTLSSEFSGHLSILTKSSATLKLEK